MKTEKMIIEMHTDLAVIKSKVSDMHKTLNGNGSPGILERLRKVENKVWYMMGGTGVIIIILQLIF